MPGSKVRIWKQDPSVTAIGIRSSYIHTSVEKGPADAEIEIRGMPEVIPNADGDFLFHPTENPKEFDAVHTFTVVRQVVTMYQRALRRMGVRDRFRWQWGSASPIHVHPRAGEDANAYYSREERSLRFYYFYPQQDETRPLVYTCRSFDVVAHETGHAILDALRPGYWASWHPQTGGLHESFGDLTAIFSMLAQMDQCEAVIAESKADLHAKTFFAAVAEQFGEALYGHRMGLRNADNDLTLDQVSNEVHAISQVFTGAVYDILADMFADHLGVEEYDPAETLFRVGQHMASLVVAALVTGPSANATYADVAQRMIALEGLAQWKEYIRHRFAERRVPEGRVRLAAEAPGRLNWDRCCGTLSHRDHVCEVEKAIAKRRHAPSSKTAPGARLSSRRGKGGNRAGSARRKRR